MKRAAWARCRRVSGVTLAAALWLSGCGPRERGGVATIPAGAELEATRPPEANRVADALAPSRLRIHPLTRLERDAAGDLRIVCHLELADRFSHSGKWLGVARVELYRPGDRPAGDGPVGASPSSVRGDDRQDTVWDVPLTDAARNAELYDWVSRTYILPLGDLPAWVEAVSEGRSRDDTMTLRAYFTLLDGGGRERVLKADYRLRRDAER